MPPAAERLEVFLIWGSSDRRNSHAGEQVRVDLLAEPRIETLEALADRAKLEFCMEARPQLLHTRTFNPIESMAELINKGDVVVVPPDEKGVRSRHPSALVNTSGPLPPLLHAVLTFAGQTQVSCCRSSRS
jgi:hypothetical protein